MSLLFNGVEITGATYNGVNLTQINYNGVAIWNSELKVIDNGVVNSLLTALKETYHTTQSNIQTTNNEFVISQNAWSGANFGTTIARIQKINGKTYKTLKINFSISGTLGGGNAGYTQGYIALLPTGADYPKFTQFNQQRIAEQYTRQYFNLSMGASQSIEIDLTSLDTNDYDIICAIGGYNSSQTTIKISQLTLN